MLLVALCLFASAALAGLFLAFRILTNRRAPPPVVLIHGGAGAAGLGCLALVVLAADEAGGPALALAILGLNAVLGFFLLSFHLRKKPWPKPLVIVHGLAAVTGFAILLLAFLSSM
jgi:hypothetical protein